MSVLNLVKKDRRDVEITPQFIAAYCKMAEMAGERASRTADSYRHYGDGAFRYDNSQDEKIWRATGTILKLIAERKSYQGVGFDPSIMFLKRLPVTKLTYAKGFVSKRPSFMAITTPLICGRVSKHTEPEQNRFGGYQTVGFYDIGKWIVEIEFNDFMSQNYTDFAAYPVGKDPVDNPMWHPHRYFGQINGAGRENHVNVCLGGFRGPVQEAAERYDFPTLLKLMIRHLQIYTIDDAICVRAASDWQETNAPQEGEWPK